MVHIQVGYCEFVGSWRNVYVGNMERDAALHESQFGQA